MKPDWYDKPIDQWPPSARAFWHLLFTGMKRNAERRLLSEAAQSGQTDLDKSTGANGKR